MHKYKKHIKYKSQRPSRSIDRYLPEIVMAKCLLEKYEGLEHPVIVAVGGPGGIGKSTFAFNLVRALGEAVVLGLDDYKTPRELRLKKNIFGPHPEANEIEMIKRHLVALKKGDTIDKPEYCSDKGAIATFSEFKPDRFVVVEGEVATYRAFRDQIDFAIFIDSDWKTQLNTRITRDVDERGYTPEKAIATFLHSNLREFAEFGSESKNWADVHIHCNEDYSLVIDAVCQTLSGDILDHDLADLV